MSMKLEFTGDHITDLHGQILNYVLVAMPAYEITLAPPKKGGNTTISLSHLDKRRRDHPDHANPTPGDVQEAYERGLRGEKSNSWIGKSEERKAAFAKGRKKYIREENRRRVEAAGQAFQIPVDITGSEGAEERWKAGWPEDATTEEQLEFLRPLARNAVAVFGMEKVLALYPRLPDGEEKPMNQFDRDELKNFWQELQWLT